jgi:hypothetical protein
MSKVYRDDEWRRVDCSTPKPTAATRASEQSRIDVEYAMGRMTQEAWRTQTDDLSEPSKWTASGKVLP